MSRLVRLLRWSFFVGCLVLVAAVTFHFVRYRPRCTIEGHFASVLRSRDGLRLLTFSEPTSFTELERGRWHFQVWDTSSGRAVHEWHIRDELKAKALSIDDRHVAICSAGAAVRLLDWQEGRE